MAQDSGQPPRFTVGSLLGLPIGATPAAAEPTAALENLPSPPPGLQEAPGWVVIGGDLSTGSARAAFRPDGVEALTYTNAFAQNVERVWFDGKIVFALDVGEIDVDPSKVKVAQEYEIVYAVDLDEQGKLRGTPDGVEGQYNIYDSVPGMDIYSPIWKFNYVVVPRGYVPNSLRSASDCETSGYPIVRSQQFEN